MTTRGLRGAVVALWIAMAFSGCATPGRGGSDAEGAAERPRRTVILTTNDDVRLGEEAAEQVAAQIGTLDDPELEAYVAGIGRKLLRGLPTRRFRYRFQIVDQMEPNAFALPGGFIFVSRGLLDRLGRPRGDRRARRGRKATPRRSRACRRKLRPTRRVWRARSTRSPAATA